MDKHTPGPWSTYLGHRVVANVHHSGMHGMLQEQIAECGHGGRAEDNARLIAAAPEMYAVLKSMEAVDDDPMANGDPRRELLLAAIAKAEGRQ